MLIKIKLEIAKILNFDFEWSSSGKKKEENSDAKKESDVPATTDNK